MAKDTGKVAGRIAALTSEAEVRATQAAAAWMAEEARLGRSREPHVGSPEWQELYAVQEDLREAYLALQDALWRVLALDGADECPPPGVPLPPSRYGMNDDDFEPRIVDVSRYRVRSPGHRSGSN